jgi:hypothetical protein
MLADVPTVDGREWDRKRIQFLQSLLEDELPADQRAAAEAELVELRKKHRGLFGWLFPARLPHQR